MGEPGGADWHVKADPVADPLNVLQMAYDILIPGNSLIDTTLDIRSTVDRDSEYNLFFYGSLKTELAGTAAKQYRMHKPKLRTAPNPKRQQNIQAGLAALYKRNMVNAHFAYPQDYEERAIEAIEWAFDALCVSDWREKVEMFKKNPITINEENASSWADAQTQEKLARYGREKGDSLMMDLDLNHFDLFLKTQGKVSTDDSTQSEVIQPQTVVFHSVLINAIFGPMFRWAEFRFMSLLKPNVLFNKKKNRDEIEEFINNSDSAENENDCTYVENDFSAYDKSQHIETWVLEGILYAMFGIAARFLALWMDAHWFTKVKSAAMGITLYVLFQRKSGDVTTSFGNTLVNIITILWAYAVVTFIYIMMLGDDSLIKLYKWDADSLRLDEAPSLLRDAFNLPSKAFRYNTGYFCGYIIVRLGTTNFIISDVVRRIVKLGRIDIALAEEFKEHHQSFRDLVKHYDSVLIVQSAVEALRERMPGDCSGLEMAYYACASLGRSYKLFRSLWSDESCLAG